MKKDNNAMQKYKADLKQEIIAAIQSKDLEKIKDLKSRVERDKWLEALAASGKGMEAWLEPNPFIIWKD